jgi:hypothetical protein
MTAQGWTLTQAYAWIDATPKAREVMRAWTEKNRRHIAAEPSEDGDVYQRVGYFPDQLLPAHAWEYPKARGVVAREFGQAELDRIVARVAERDREQLEIAQSYGLGSVQAAELVLLALAQTAVRLDEDAKSRG